MMKDEEIDEGREKREERCHIIQGSEGRLGTTIGN